MSHFGHLTLMPAVHLAFDDDFILRDSQVNAVRFDLGAVLERSPNAQFYICHQNLRSNLDMVSDTDDTGELADGFLRRNLVNVLRGCSRRGTLIRINEKPR